MVIDQPRRESHHLELQGRSSEAVFFFVEYVRLVTLEPLVSGLAGVPLLELEVIDVAECSDRFFWRFFSVVISDVADEFNTSALVSGIVAATVGSYDVSVSH